MEHIAAIMMLIGCSQGNLDCRELPSSSVGFETVEECQELLHPSINGFRGAHRVVYGKCASVDPALFIEDATINWEVTPEGQLDVDVVFDDPGIPMMLAEKTGRAPIQSN